MYDLSVNILSKAKCSEDDYNELLKQVRVAVDSGVKKMIISTRDLERDIESSIEAMESRVKIINEKISESELDIKVYLSKCIKVNEVDSYIKDIENKRAEYLFIDVDKSRQDKMKEILVELSMIGVVPIIENAKNRNEEARLSILNNDLHKNHIDMQSYLDQSITLSKTYINDYLDGKHEDITKTKYMLVNLNDTMTDEQVDLVFELTLRGVVPIIIHPERCKEIIEKNSRIEKLKEIGCLFQLDMNSLKGLNGKASKKCAKKLLRRNMYDLISKDINARKLNSEKVNTSIFGAWISKNKRNKFEINSKKVLNNENIKREETKKKNSKLVVKDNGISYY